MRRLLFALIGLLVLIAASVWAFDPPEDRLPDGTMIATATNLVISAGPVPSADVTAPEFLMATIAADGETVQIIFTENVTGTENDTFDLDCDGDSGANVALTYSSGSGGTSLTFTAGETIQSTETCNLDFDGDADDFEDDAGNDLADFSDESVTNNSEQSGGQTFAETFTYSDGELATVSSNAWVKLTGTNSNVASGVFALAADTVYLYATQTSTMSQYAAVELASSPNSYSGIYVRQVATDNSTTLAYALRQNNQDDLLLRYCTGVSCTDIATVDPGTIGENDSFGLEVTGTGSSTQWKVWYWDNATPPARESWGTCDYGVYISGQSATTCDTGNQAVSDLGSNYADTGKYAGLYHGGGDTQSMDNWMAGDI